MRYIAYVDGFNLYHRCLKNTPYKWLDIHTLLNSLNIEPGEIIIKYFTARVINKPRDPSIAQRQQTYLRALKTVSGTKLFFGQFKLRDVRGELLDEIHNTDKQSSIFKPTGKIVCVRKYEEKGSDVNIASHMIADGFQNKYDVAILISNDSDLSAPLQIIKEVIGKPTGLINPCRSSYMVELSKFASFKRKIKEEHLKQSQFPNVLTDQHGSFSKPQSW